MARRKKKAAARKDEESARRRAPARQRRGPLYLRIYKDLLDAIRAGKHRQWEMLPSEHELCARYDTSRQTVRNALKLLEEGSMVTTLPGRGWQVVSQSSDPNASRRIGFAALNTNAAVGAILAATLQRELTAAGFAFETAPVVCVDDAESEQRLREWARARKLRGLLLFGDSRMPAAAEQAVAGLHPGAMVLGLQAHCACDTICTDNYQASRLLVNHLVELGHRRILFTMSRGFIARVPSFEMRLHGYRAAMRAHGLEPLVLLGNYNAWGLPEEEKLLMNELARARSRGSPVTAVIAAANGTAISMLEVLLRHSLRVPRDISLASYGGLHEANLGVPHGIPNLTFAEERWEDLARRAARRLAARLGRPRGERPEPELLLIPSRMVAGDSACRPQGRNKR